MAAEQHLTSRAAPATVPAAPAAPATIRVLMAENGEAKDVVMDDQGRVVILDRTKLVQYSRAFRIFLAEWQVFDESHRDIILPEGCATPEGLRAVLFAIHKYNPARDRHVVKITDRINTGDRCSIWQAAYALRLLPDTARDQLLNNIAYRISHEKPTPDSMTKVHKVFRQYKDTLTPYATIVHQHCWSKLQGNEYSAQELAAIEATIAALPGLAKDVEEKMATLLPRRRQYEKFQAMNQARRERGQAAARARGQRGNRR